MRKAKKKYPPRGKFRPFSSELHKAEGPTPWSDDKDRALTTSRHVCHAVATLIEEVRARAPTDERVNYELDEARKHLELCAMRITRGVTSVR